MKRVSFSVPTLSDAKALWAKAQAKHQQRKELAQARSEALDALARELLRQKGAKRA